MSKRSLKDGGAAGAKVAVLMGGISREREISLQSGQCVEEALRRAGVNVVAVDVSPDNLAILDDKTIDVFFLALHGRWGEDGELQGILEEKGLIYTGSGPVASRLAFDKIKTKELFAKAGVAVAADVVFDPTAARERIGRQVAGLGSRYVIKPLREGSTIGISVADSPAAAIEAAAKCHSEFGDCMIEQYIAGRELTVGVLNGSALPIIEVRTTSGFYDFKAKYIDEQTQYLFDTIEDGQLQRRIQDAAVKGFNALGCRHVARIDFILRDDGKAFALEANTIPGLTSHSLLPKAAAKIGLSMSDLCLKIVEAALTDETKRRL